MENSTIKEFGRTDRVKVSSCVAWDIGFHSEVARRDITIPGGAKGYSLLTVDAVEDEILRQNTFFTGLDGLGDHACLVIEDPEMYRYLFRTEDQTRHFSKDTLMELLSLSSKNKFAEAMKEAIVRPFEAKMCLYYMSDISWSEYLGWKHDILESHCRGLMR